MSSTEDNALKAQRSSQPWSMVPSIFIAGQPDSDRGRDGDGGRGPDGRDDARRRYAGVWRAGRRCACCSRAGTESEWVAQTIEAWGHEVIVADPNYALMYGSGRGGSRRTSAMWRRWPRRAAWGSTARRIA